MKESEGKEEGESIHPVHGISRRNQFLIWLSGWQNWRTNSATMDLITQNCPREREDERQREVMREVGGMRNTSRRRETLRWREECEMGDSKVTVWERDGEAEVAVERQMVTCRRREESVETRLGG